MNTTVFDIRHDRFQPGGERPAFGHIAAWEELRSSIESDAPLLARFPPERLRQRWSDGMAIIAVDLTRIVAYTSLVEIPLDLEDRAVQVFEASSGWTLPGYRRKGLQVRMRRRLYSERSGGLMISFCVGLGSAYVLRRLGWSLYSWPDRLGVSDFIGRVEGGRLHHRLGDVIDLGGRQPFRLAGPVDLDRHAWDRYLHLWVSSADKAAELRERILTASEARVQA